MSEFKQKKSPFAAGVVILSLLLIFLTIPHTLEDFALGEPAKNGVPAVLLATVIAGLFTLQGLALYWAGQKDLSRVSAFIHAGLGLFWSITAGTAQLPVILTSTHFRAGFISVLYVAGMVVVGLLLFVASLISLKTSASRSTGKH